MSCGSTARPPRRATVSAIRRPEIAVMLATTTGSSCRRRSGVVRSTSSRDPTSERFGTMKTSAYVRSCCGTAVTDEAHGPSVPTGDGRAGSGRVVPDAARGRRRSGNSRTSRMSQPSTPVADARAGPDWWRSRPCRRVPRGGAPPRHPPRRSAARELATGAAVRRDPAIRVGASRCVVSADAARAELAEVGTDQRPQRGPDRAGDQAASAAGVADVAASSSARRSRPVSPGRRASRRRRLPGAPPG